MSPSPVHSSWEQWAHPQQPHNGYMMDSHGYPQYDTRVVTTAPLVAPTMAPQYVTGPQYGIPAMAPREPHYVPHGHYSYTYEQTHQGMPMQYGRYTPPVDRNTMGPIPTHGMPEQRQFTAPPTPESDYGRRSPSARSETLSVLKTPDPMNAKDITFNKPVRQEEVELVEFKTPIDIMMKAIQGKDNKEMAVSDSGSDAGDVDVNMDAAASPSTASDSASESSRGKGKVKKYRCPFDGCSKSFSQSTHLETHKRAHTGEKPYRCDWVGCNRSFSQPGNLKTHRRLHTGERPFRCERCDSTFAQRGNLKAHLVTHSQTKPFVCKLDGCNKCFTTRGNLKNHQNKYHKQTIQQLVDWIVSITDVESLTSEEKELLWYFSNIYKNSNKGIKGRGRDRRVSGIRVSKTKAPCDMVPHSHKMMMVSSQLGAMGF